MLFSPAEAEYSNVFLPILGWKYACKYSYTSATSDLCLHYCKQARDFSDLHRIVAYDIFLFEWI